MKTTTQPDTQWRKMGDLNTQKGNDGSENIVNKADTNECDATEEANLNTLNQENVFTWSVQRPTVWKVALYRSPMKVMGLFP